jgi:hypothetical protein
MLAVGLRPQIQAEGRIDGVFATVDSTLGRERDELEFSTAASQGAYEVRVVRET